MKQERRACRAVEGVGSGVCRRAGGEPRVARAPGGHGQSTLGGDGKSNGGGQVQKESARGSFYQQRDTAPAEGFRCKYDRVPIPGVILIM